MKVNVIKSSDITEAVKRLCITANMKLPADVADKLSVAHDMEDSPISKSALSDILDNLTASRELSLPICQDTGMAVVFAEIGQGCVIEGNPFCDAVNEGVRQGYTEGLLRLSVVGDPLRRINTNDNTPAVIHTFIVPGDRIKITVAPKGFGSENMSGIRFLQPSASRDEVIEAICEIVFAAGSNPCPPIVVGVGIGGDFELCALMAKKALLQDISQPNPDEYYALLERDILNKINENGVGVQGFGGRTTALAVMIESYATHIAGLPVAVNIGCHVTRHASVII